MLLQLWPAGEVVRVGRSQDVVHVAAVELIVFKLPGSMWLVALAHINLMR